MEKNINGNSKELFDRISEKKKKDQYIILIWTNENEEKNGILIVDIINKKETKIFFHEIFDFKIECICLIDNYRKY